MTFFLSDTHFNHSKPFIYEVRGYASIQEHDESIIKNINNTVGIDDDVYFLGDFSWGKHKFYLDKITVGQWNFIEGNHDKGLYEACKNWNLFKSYNKGYLDIDINGTKIVLCHYPMISWNCSFHNSLHLYGHCHANTPANASPNSYNVSMDIIKNTPISLEQVIEYMKGKDEE